MIESYNDFFDLISDYLIRGIFISVIVLAIVQRLFKKMDIQYAKLVLKWIMIGYAGLAIINLLMTLINEFYNGVGFAGYSFGDWAFGNNWFSYWFMLIGNIILPFILLSKRISNNLFFLFMVAIMMNIGWLFEWFVIAVTSLHRDYLTEDGDFKFSQLFPYSNWIYLLRGLILGIIVLGIGQSLIRKEEPGPIDKDFHL